MHETESQDIRISLEGQTAPLALLSVRKALAGLRPGTALLVGPCDKETAGMITRYAERLGLGAAEVDWTEGRAGGGVRLLSP